MPNTILGPNGLPAHFDSLPNIRTEKTLSLRDGDIMRDVTLWQMEHELEPTLVCRECFTKYDRDIAHKDDWMITIAASPDGIITATCSCSVWTTERS